eukprot:135429-Hanusia_phi.AAC.2
MQRAFLEYDSFFLEASTDLAAVTVLGLHLLAGHGAFEQEHTRGLEGLRANAIYMLHCCPRLKLRSFSSPTCFRVEG